MRILIPACLLSQPNSLMVSPALKTTSFLTMYSRYWRLLEALCSHAAPHSNSSCKTQFRSSTVKLKVKIYFCADLMAENSHLITVDVAVKGTNRVVQASTVRSPVPVSKLENLHHNRLLQRSFSRDILNITFNKYALYIYSILTTMIH